MKKIILTSALSSALILSGCGGGGDDAAQVIADEFVSISGKVTSSTNTAGEEGATVKGIYSDNDPLNPSITTETDGTFSLSVLKATGVSAQISKSGFVTLNSAKMALSANESGFDIELPTTTEADQVILDVFGEGPTLVGSAWLAVNVIDAADNDVAGVTVNTTGNPAAAAATDCNGNDSGDIVTIAPCSNRTSPMYFAYFDTDSTEVTVTVGSDMQLAPVRRGEVTFLEFEAGTAPAGNILAGQLKYDAACESCHAAGTHDPVGNASDLYNDGDKLIVNISSYAPVKKSGVADLTAQEILDLTAFLDDPSIAP